MRLERLVIVLLTVTLVFALGGAVRADQKGVLAKIAEAEKAEGEAAAAAFTAAGNMVEADVAGAGDYVGAVGKAVATRLGALAEAATAAEPDEELSVEAVRMRVGDLYGALLPASQGKFDEAASFIRSAAADAPVGARQKLEAMAKAAAGEDKDLAMKGVKAGVILNYFSRGLAALNDGDRKSGIALVKLGVGYFIQEVDIAGDAKDDFRETAAMLKMELDALQKMAMDPEESAGTVLPMMDAAMGEMTGVVLEE